MVLTQLRFLEPHRYRQRGRAVSSLATPMKGVPDFKCAYLLLINDFSGIFSLQKDLSDPFAPAAQKLSGRLHILVVNGRRDEAQKTVLPHAIAYRPESDLGDQS